MCFFFFFNISYILSAFDLRTSTILWCCPEQTRTVISEKLTSTISLTKMSTSLSSPYTHEKKTAFFPIVYNRYYTWRLWIHVLLPLGSKDSSNQDNLSAPFNMPAPDLISSTLCFASASVVSTEVAAEPGAGWLDEIIQTGKNKKKSNPLMCC